VVKKKSPRILVSAVFVALKSKKLKGGVGLCFFNELLMMDGWSRVVCMAVENLDSYGVIPVAGGLRY
jgi:hypothetical protein